MDTITGDQSDLPVVRLCQACIVCLPGQIAQRKAKFDQRSEIRLFPGTVTGIADLCFYCTCQPVNGLNAWRHLLHLVLYRTGTGKAYFIAGSSWYGGCGITLLRIESYRLGTCGNLGKTYCGFPW